MWTPMGQSEVSSFQRLKCMQGWYLGWKKVSCLEISGILWNRHNNYREDTSKNDTFSRPKYIQLLHVFRNEETSDIFFCSIGARNRK